MDDSLPTLPQQNRRLAAVVFTDVVGYSTRMHADETGTIAGVGADHSQMRKMCAEHGGEFLNSMGDGLMLAFPSAVNAVSYALRVQDAFAARKANLQEDATLEHRIGIHLGDVILLDDGTVAGDGVNIAARLEAKAPSGGICISQMVYDTVKGMVPMKATFLGPEKFKNIAEPIPIYHISTALKTEVSAATPVLQPKTARRLAAGMVASALMIVAAASWWLWSHRTVTTDASVNTKSIAVLPFANMSDDKENSLFFADGMHEDILTNLALIRDLRVVSRTSVMQYRASTKPIRQIGQELGVAYLLEGSVRRAGNKVRVTGQLINARTDEHMWAKSYDRDLTDIFAIQATLAKEIASSLQAALSPQETTFIERRPTENLAAYDLLLQARALWNNGNSSLADVEKRIGLLESAVALDPQFAVAWGELSVAHAQNVFWGGDTSDARLVKAKAASDKSVELAADSPDVIRALGDYYYYGYRDYAQAQTQFEKLVRLKPNDPTGYNSIGLIQRRQNRWAESLANFQKAEQLEPSNIAFIRSVATNLNRGRRFDEAIAQVRRIVAFRPLDFGETIALYALAFQKNGSTKEWEERIRAMTAGELETPAIREFRKLLAEITGDLAEYRRLDRLVPYAKEYNFGREDAEQALAAATVYAAGGDWTAARNRLENYPKEYRSRLEREPANAYLWSHLGMMEAMLGHKEDALRFARKAVELLPESRDAFRGPELAESLAFVYAWTGDKDRAIAELARLLRVPGFGLNVHYLRRSAWFTPLRGDPRFEALLDDPKNNAPLF